MVVQTHDRHPGRSGTLGLHIGAVNVQQYFPRDVQLVELELDHLRIVCPLEPSFWEDHPEIHDLRLSSWLESKRNSGKLGSQSAPVSMIPSGKCSFRLQMMSQNEVDRLPAGSPAVAYFSPTTSPSALLERRKHNTSGKPERRGIVRLKGDDSTSSSAND
jgi:hypothetical protein